MTVMQLSTNRRTRRAALSLSQRFEDTLRTAGRSLTLPRRLVFTVLTHGPVTLVSLAVALEGQTDKASVYRTIQLFERLGLINRMWHGGKNYIELSEVFTPHHHHAVCQRCGGVTDIAASELELAVAQLAKRHGFLSVSHSIELSGYCGECLVT